MNCAFMGLGNMGAPLARCLIRAKESVLVYNRSPEKAAAVLAAGTHAAQATSLKDFSSCNVVFTCLALPEHVEAATTGPNGFYQYLKAGTVHVEMSTIAPQTALALQGAAANKGLDYVQCTVGKTPAHAERGEAPLFIGGDAAGVEKLRDIFALLGVPNYVGTVSAACAIKLISNMVGMTNVLVLAEGLGLGQAAGLSPAEILPLLQDTGARSFQMDVRGPLIAHEDWKAGFALDLALKDLRLGCAMAEQWGVIPQAIGAAHESFLRASQSGLGNEDCCAVFKSLK